MRLNLLLVLAAGTMTLAGCSSTPTKVDTGPMRGRTFNFVDPGPKPSPAFADNRQVIHGMIQDAITRNLSTKGVSRVAAGGEVTVGYLVIVGNNTTTASINDYFGYSEDSAALHDKAQDAYTGRKDPNYFEAGTLVIDVLDSKSLKLLQRGYASRPVLRNLPPDARAARLQEVVDQILRDVRFTQ